MGDNLQVNYLFPDPRTDCLDEGIIAVSADLDLTMLLEAYTRGIFPWPYEEDEVLWFCPPDRGVLFFDDLRVPKSLEKAQKKALYTFTFDKAFDRVIEECAKAPRAEQDGTWITQKMLSAYKELFRQGHILCCEAWQGEQLVGGIYGVFIEGIFSGESMFYKKANASKLALLEMIKELQKRGLKWMDTQMVTPVTEALGAKEISRDDYLDLLEASKKNN